MDKEWLHKSRLSKAYRVGARNFAIAACERRGGNTDLIPCPCSKCKNLQHHHFDIVYEHLVIKGMDPTYTTWVLHGERCNASKVHEDKNVMDEHQTSNGEDDLQEENVAEETSDGRVEVSTDLVRSPRRNDNTATEQESKRPLLVDTPQSRYEETMSSDEGSNSLDMSTSIEEDPQSSNQSASKLKRKRGPTKLEMFFLDEASRLRVEFNERGQLISKNSAKLSSFLGVIARDHVPIVIDDWRRVDSHKKEELWTLVLEKFIIDDCHKSMIIQIIGKCWRQYKARVTKQIKQANKKPDKTTAIALVRPSNVISDEEWDKFVQERLSSKFQAKSEKFRKMRKNQKFVHTMSRKGYARLEHEMKKEKASPSTVSRVDVWTRAHLKRNGEPLNEEIVNIMEGLERCTRSKSNEPECKIKEDALAKMLGEEQHGRARGLGFGATPSRVDAQIQFNERIRAIEDKLQAQAQQINNIDEMITSLLNKFQQGGEEVHDNFELKNVRCQLLHWYVLDKEEVVAEGRIVSIDPTAKVHQMPLGRDCWKIKVEKIVDPNVYLYRTTDEKRLLKEVSRAAVIWPKSSIKLLR